MRQFGEAVTACGTDRNIVGVHKGVVTMEQNTTSQLTTLFTLDRVTQKIQNIGILVSIRSISLRKIFDEYRPITIPKTVAIRFLLPEMTLGCFDLG